MTAFSRIIMVSNACLYCGNLTKRTFCSNSCSVKYRYESKDKLLLHDNLHEIIEGTLFSDAGLELDRSRRSINPRYYFKQTLRSREYVDLVASHFNLLDKITIVKNSTKYKDGGSIYDARFKTGASKKLLPYYQRWYIDGKKIIPPDFKITPLCLLHAYLGDGYMYNRTSHFGKYKSPCQVFCTDCFEKDNIYNNFVIPLSKVGIESYIDVKNSVGRNQYSRVIIRRTSFDRFFEYIGPSPVQCLEYKWHTNYKNFPAEAS